MLLCSYFWFSSYILIYVMLHCITFHIPLLFTDRISLGNILPSKLVSLSISSSTNRTWHHVSPNEDISFHQSYYPYIYNYPWHRIPPMIYPPWALKPRYSSLHNALGSGSHRTFSLLICKSMRKLRLVWFQKALLVLIVLLGLTSYFLCHSFANGLGRCIKAYFTHRICWFILVEDEHCEPNCV